MNSADEQDEADSDVDDPAEDLFRLGEFGTLFVGFLQARIRELLNRSELSPKQIHFIGVNLHALQRLPRPTPGVAISLILSRRVGDEMQYQTVSIDESEFRIDSGGSTWSEAVGGDSDSETVFEAFVGADHEEPDWPSVSQWSAAFGKRVKDEVWELDFEWNGDESEIDWEADEADPGK